MTREELEKKYLGKRVAVYMPGGKRIGVVNRLFDIYDEGFGFVIHLFSQTDNMLVTQKDLECYVHPKQVRLLKKKELRRIWVKFKQRIETTAPDGYTKHVSYHDCVYHPDGSFPGDAIEFIEVKK